MKLMLSKLQSDQRMAPSTPILPRNKTSCFRRLESLIELARGRLRRSKQPSFARLTSDDESALLFSVRWWDISMELRLYTNSCNWMGVAHMRPPMPPTYQSV